MISKKWVCRYVGLAFLTALTGCAPSFYMVKTPQPSALKYVSVDSQSSSRLLVLDERKGEDQTFSAGVLPATLKLNKDPIDPPQFLAKGVEDELRSRGLQVQASVGGEGAPKVHLKTFRVQNHRASGFSPFFTFTYLAADLDVPSGSRRIGVYVRRGKVPVWSFDEVIEPTFNQPLSIAIKEFSSKVAKLVYGYRTDDATVKQLLDKVAGTRTEQTYLDVYSLGFTNNPLAIPKLVELTQDGDEYVRQAAIASLGTLGATDQFSLLQNIYLKDGASRQDKDMALKAIADLGTRESNDFIGAEFKRLGTLTDPDALWTMRVLSLYL